MDREKLFVFVFTRYTSTYACVAHDMGKNDKRTEEWLILYF